MTYCRFFVIFQIEREEFISLCQMQAIEISLRELTSNDLVKSLQVADL